MEECATMAEDFGRLLRLLVTDFTFEVDTHPAVEATMFHQPDRRRYLFSLVNFQPLLPNIPIRDILVRTRLPQRIRGIQTIFGEPAQIVQRQKDYTRLKVSRLDTLSVVSLDYA
jgi:hypothetical protein